VLLYAFAWYDLNRLRRSLAAPSFDRSRPGGPEPLIVPVDSVLPAPSGPSKGPTQVEELEGPFERTEKGPPDPPPQGPFDRTER
jgi:hypothetical protein